MLSAAGMTACATSASITAPAPAKVHAPSESGMPFSPVVRVGPVLYLSGQIGTTSMRPPTLIAGGIEAEARQDLENIKGVLAKSGATMDDIVKCTVMMADMREWAAMNAVYATDFPNHKPARSTSVRRVSPSARRVEIECPPWLSALKVARARRRRREADAKMTGPTECTRSDNTTASRSRLW